MASEMGGLYSALKQTLLKTESRPGQYANVIRAIHLDLDNNGKTGDQRLNSLSSLSIVDMTDLLVTLK